MRLAFAIAAAVALWVQPADAATFLISGNVTITGNDSPSCLSPDIYPEPCVYGSTYDVGASFLVSEDTGDYTAIAQTFDGIHYGFSYGYSANSGVFTGSFHRTLADWFVGDSLSYTQTFFTCLGEGGPLPVDCAFDGSTNRFSVVQVDPAPQAPVPEPSTWAMMLLGFFGLGATLRRRKLGVWPRERAAIA